MNTSSKDLADEKDRKFTLLNRITTLNPNAPEFVPSALKYTRSNKSSDVKKLEDLGSFRNVVFDQLESGKSGKSEDEANQYWHHQLPDDITPDFKLMGDEFDGSTHLPVSSVSMNNNIIPPRFLGSIANQMLDVSEGMPPFIKNHRSRGTIGYSGPAYGEEQSSATFMSSASNSWNKTSANSINHNINGKDGRNKNASFRDITFVQNAAVDPIEHLTPSLPDCASEILTNIYHGNRCGSNSKVDLITQDKKIGGYFSLNLNSKLLSTPRNSLPDCTAMPMVDAHVGLSKSPGEDVMLRNNSIIPRRDMDFALNIRQLPLVDSRGNGYTDCDAGLLGTSHLLANSLYGDKDAAQSGASWLNMGEAMEPRGQDYEFANLQNVYFEKATQAYLIGRKAFAKELSLKELLDNLKMKAAIEKAKEASYGQRNKLFLEMQSSSPPLNYPINLYGFRVAEAINYLNHELSILQSKARSSGQKLYALIFVGNGKDTMVDHSSASLVSMAVEMYLLEKGFYFTKPELDLLRVVIH
ncbi:polyadenylate-binding protein-interacting protein 7-like isoform X1 [Canna indica]|uniref:Polyadenylate-binding protein-interacting protein 7-like isoform X1 n=1 Tax=Canna indica TaxID=4628 RepID=A0AAQ3JQQ7_9LILI|nr:polyadenylate-binding protein-interacting protein 7-like isoform X1 [Canna indica]